jgi:hypothetical protein
VDEAVLDAIEARFAALEEQASCQRVATVLKGVEALNIKLGARRIKWIGLRIDIARRAGIDVDRAAECLETVYGEVPIFSFIGN